MTGDDIRQARTEAPPMTKTYNCKRFKSVGAFQYQADFAEASSAILVRFKDEFQPGGYSDWEQMPIQVADVRHSRNDAETAIARFLALPR